MSSQEEIRLAEVLYKTFTSGNEDIRREAEKELQERAKDLMTYAQTLFGVILAENQQITSQIKSSAVIQLRQATLQSLEAASTPLSLRLHIAQQVFVCLTRSLLDSTLQSHLCYVLTLVLAADSSDPEGLTCLQLQPSIQDRLTNGNFREVLGSMRAVRAAFASISTSSASNLTAFYHQIAAILLKIAKFSLNRYNSTLETGEKLGIMESISILEELSCVYSSIFEYFELSSRKTLSELTGDLQLSEVLREMLLIRYPDPVLSVFSLICVDSTAISVSFNNIKTQLLSGLSLLLQYMVTHKKKSISASSAGITVLTVVGVAIPPCSLLNTVMAVVGEFGRCAGEIGRRTDADEVMQLEFVAGAVVEGVGMVGKCVGEVTFYQMFANNYKDVLLDICLPFLRSPSSELDLLSSSPDEFAALSLDTVQTQESNTPKTTSAQLLSGLCSSIDGALAFAVSLFSQIIDFTITGSYFSLIHLYPALSDPHPRIQPFLSLSDETRVETSLLCISVLTYLIHERKDLKEIVERLVMKHVEVMTRTGSELVQARVYLMLGRWMEGGGQQGEAIGKELQFLLSALNPFSVPPACHSQACLSFSSLLHDEDFLCNLRSSLPVILRTLVDILPYQHEKGYFDALQDLVMSDTPAVIPALKELIDGLVGKVREVHGEIHSNEKEKAGKQGSLIIVKCWNVIRAIADCEEIVPEYMNLIEDSLSPLFNYISDPSSIDFEDDIVLVWVSFVTKSHSVPAQGWFLFERFPLIQQKYRGDFGQLFSALNAFLTYGRDVIAGKREYVEIVVEMCRQALFAEREAGGAEWAQAEGLLLLQQSFLTLPQSLDQFLPSILTFLLQRFSSPTKTSLFRVRLLATFLSAFRYSPGQTLSLLSTRMREIVGEIEGCADSFRHEYDKKVATLGVMELIGWEMNREGVSEGVVRLFSTLVGIMTAKNGGGDSEQLPVPGSRSKSPPSDSDLHSDDDPIAPPAPEDEESDSNLALNSMLNPLSSFDETEHLRTCLASLAQSVPSAFQVLLTSLPESRAEQYKRLVESRRIGVGEGSEVRRVVKAKRRLGK